MTEEAVLTDGEIDTVSHCNARRIPVVVLSACRWNTNTCGTEACGTGAYRLQSAGKARGAMKPHLPLFVSGEAQGGYIVRHSDRNQTAVIAVRNSSPRPTMADLIPRIQIHRQSLIVVRARNAAVRRAEAHASRLRTEEPGAEMAHGQIASETMRRRDGRAEQCSVNLGLSELRGECQWAVEQHIEIVGPVGELPQILSTEREQLRHLRLESDIELVAPACLQNRGFYCA